MITKDQYIEEEFTVGAPTTLGYIKHVANQWNWYYKDGILHREDGPAIESFDKSKGNQFFLHGVELTKEEFILIKKKIDETDLPVAIDLLRV